MSHHTVKNANADDLLELSRQDRFKYLVRNSADSQRVWGLKTDENWLIFRDEDGDEIFPVWPHEALADKCCFAEHKALGAKPHAITVDSFVNACIPDMLESSVGFGVFYDSNRKGLVVDGRDLKAAIENELAYWRD